MSTLTMAEADAALLKLYEDQTGICITEPEQKRMLAQMKRSKRVLESLLGYPLSGEAVTTNNYTELGKTESECPCLDFNSDTLLPADDVVGAYRLFPYNKKDIFLHIDPASVIHKVKLVKDNVTFKTFDADFYRIQSKYGFISFIQRCDLWLKCIYNDCDCVQLAVDADWLWESDTDIPQELLDIWMDMTAYYSDDKSNVKSETLGTHSYSKFENVKPEEKEENINILRKYVGGNGTLNQTLVI
ncbi:MAG: hypothetical protein ACEQR7_10630 [Agathobacter rectalis]